MSPSPGTDVATFDPATSRYPVLFGGEGGGDLTEMLQENLGDEGFTVSDLPRVKVPTGGALYFDMGEDGAPTKTLTGVVVLWTMFRSYYEKAFGAEGAATDAPPDCASPDTKIGYGEYGKGSAKHPSGECASCPMNQWQSARQGEGKACSERRGLWMLFEGDILPTQVVLPPTSIKALRQHMIGLTRQQKPYYSVVTSLSLEKVTGGRVDYARVVVKRGADLDPAEAAAAKRYGDGIRRSLDEATRAQAAARTSGQTPAAASDPWAAEDAGPDIPEGYQG